MVPQCPPHTSEHSDSRCRETRHPAECSPQRAPTSPPVSLLPTLPPQPFLRVSRIPEVPHLSVSRFFMLNPLFNSTVILIKKKHLVSSLKKFKSPIFHLLKSPSFAQKTRLVAPLGAFPSNVTCGAKGGAPKASETSRITEASRVSRSPEGRIHTEKAIAQDAIGGCKNLKVRPGPYLANHIPKCGRNSVNIKVCILYTISFEFLATFHNHLNIIRRIITWYM